ncbi:GNAT family N-acetyltransferase [Archangium minus]|uniref:GNAT family N-acetyltransferase n=1 Tax=Archangium minus TaxID=83450 RepID=A0ABY9X3R1_9BACT|nr:GNAT family N-acetyltransferase [Archangium minus]
MKLSIATAAEKRERDLLAYEDWGQKLTPEQFVGAEEKQREHAWSKSGMTTWLLREEGPEVLASCETYRMNAVVRANGRTTRGIVFGVASVFVESRLRGRGLATRLMSALERTLVEQEPGALASVLFSDVGPDLYSRVGYVPRPAVDVLFDAHPGSPEAEVDRLLSEKEVAAELESCRPPDEGFIIWPSAAQLDWHIERERIYAGLLGHQRPEFHGAVAGSSRAFWAADLKSDQLLVLLLDARTPDEAEALLRCAGRVAHRAGLQEVVVWESPLPFSWPGSQARRVERESVPMIRPLNANVHPDSWTLIPRGIWV